MKQFVTVFLGNFETTDRLQKYLKVGYTDDGDSIPSEFEKDFRLDYYNRDLVEQDWINPPKNNLSKILEGFSYDTQIIPQLVKDIDFFNTIILVYDYKYKDGKRIESGQDYIIQIVGSAEYEI